MSTRTVSVQEAEKRLAELFGLAQQGDEIVIARDDKARVKLVPIPPKANKRFFGQHRGKIRMREDFDAPLREEIHQEDLLADWNLAVNGKKLFPIKGLDQ